MEPAILAAAARAWRSLDLPPCVRSAFAEIAEATA
jgi:hypothetical protein